MLHTIWARQTEHNSPIQPYFLQPMYHFCAKVLIILSYNCNSIPQHNQVYWLEIFYLLYTLKHRISSDVNRC